MPDRYLTDAPGSPTLREALDSSAGAGDAGKIVALNASGDIDVTMLPPGVGIDERNVEASENIAAGDLVNLWNDGGTLKVRKADATATGKRAHGFCNSAITALSTGAVTFAGTITGLSALTIGAEYYLSDSVPGGVTTTIPAGTGEIIQSIGVALSTTEIAWHKGDVYEIE